MKRVMDMVAAEEIAEGVEMMLPLGHPVQHTALVDQVLFVLSTGPLTVREQVLLMIDGPSNPRALPASLVYDRILFQSSSTPCLSFPLCVGSSVPRSRE